VKSKAYGEHYRAPRGSRSKALLNPAMKAHGRRLRKSTIPAKLIMDALQPFRQNFTGGMLWQRLVKHFALQGKLGAPYSVTGIEYWDLNAAHPTSRIIVPMVEIIPQDDFSSLVVKVNYSFSTRFLQRKRDVTSFRITLIFLFPDFEKNEITTVPHVMPDKLLNDFEPCSFIVEVPRRANSYLACFKAEACLNGEIYQNTHHVNKAMCLLRSGTRY
jgi:hypothetical protein